MFPCLVHPHAWINIDPTRSLRTSSAILYLSMSLKIHLLYLMLWWRVKKGSFDLVLTHYRLPHVQLTYMRKSRLDAKMPDTDFCRPLCVRILDGNLHPQFLDVNWTQTVKGGRFLNLFYCFKCNSNLDASISTNIYYFVLSSY